MFMMLFCNTSVENMPEIFVTVIVNLLNFYCIWLFFLCMICLVIFEFMIS